MLLHRLHMWTLRRLAFLTALALAPVAAGCAAPAGDDATAAASALGSVPEYDEVIANGTEITTSEERTEAQSASTTLLGWIPEREAGEVLQQFLSVERWTEIRDEEGERPFTKAKVVSDGADDGARTIDAKVELDGGVELDVELTATRSGDELSIHATNTSRYRHWLAGTILKEGKLAIDVTLVPYEGGVIVEATMSVKLEKMEDRAPGLTGSIGVIFDWLKAPPR